MKTDQAIIFDLDGTLWDSRHLVYLIWNRVFERTPEIQVLVSREDMDVLMGKTMEEIGACLRESGTQASALVKAADRISAYIHCLEEQRAGNLEFDAAAESILKSIHALNLPEAEDFMRSCVPAFSLTLDELNR